MRSISYVGKSRNNAVLLLMLPVVAGIVAGSFFGASDKMSGNFLIHQYFAPVCTGQSVAEYAVCGFAFSVVFTAAAFLAGFCAIGQPFGMILLVYRGFGIGASSAFMYSLHGRGAFTEVLTLVLPKALMCTFAAMLTVREMLRAADYTLSCWLPDMMKERKPVELRLYIIKFLVLSLILLIISAADAALNLIFGS